ncbi:hypothetical protein KP509_1Z102500 [Ceratopteris richardii]|nr:hypothetical protein KP509_1Z102500 [Ceratopteris richardii]
MVAEESELLAVDDRLQGLQEAQLDREVRVNALLYSEKCEQEEHQLETETSAYVHSYMEGEAITQTQAVLEEQAEGIYQEGMQEEGDLYQYYYSWPVLNFEEVPERLYHFHHQFKAHLKKSVSKNNFLKGAKWSPDGSCFLTSSEDCYFRVFDLPSDSDCYSCTLDDSSIQEDSFSSNLELCEGESIYDFCWYPCMSASVPVTCVFAATTRDHPVHLWDAITGQLRCSYRAYDAMDEITAAYSVAFDASGARLFCGYNKAIRVFDTSRPGREFKQYSNTKDGQKGIISCLAFNPCNMGVFAAGSYDRTTGVYTEDNVELLYVLHGQEGGVTQVVVIFIEIV